MPFSVKSCDLLQRIIGNINHAESLFEQSKAVIVAEPIIQERLVIYLPQAAFGFLWHDSLMKNDYIPEILVGISFFWCLYSKYSNTY